MLWLKINKQSPDKIFLVVRNSSTSTLATGYGVVYDYRTDTGGQNDGYSVRYAADFYTDGTNRNLFAGVVSGRPIYPGGFGAIQVWGHCDYLVVTGETSGFAGLWNSVSSQIISDVDLTSLFLEPIDIYYYDTYPGMFALVSKANDFNRIGAPPLVQIVDAIIPDGATTYGTLARTSFGTTKGFVRCL